MRYVEDIRESLNRAPDALSTKHHLLELAEVILFRLHNQNELGQWEMYQLSQAVGHLRLNVEGVAMQSSTAWLSAAEVSIVKSLVPPSVRNRETDASLDAMNSLSYEQLMEEIRRLRALLRSEA
jgi:hypothetical protein